MSLPSRDWTSDLSSLCVAIHLPVYLTSPNSNYPNIFYLKFRVIPMCAAWIVCLAPSPVGSQLVPHPYTSVLKLSTAKSIVASSTLSDLPGFPLDIFAHRLNILTFGLLFILNYPSPTVTSASTASPSSNSPAYVDVSDRRYCCCCSRWMSTLPMTVILFVFFVRLCLAH